MRNPLFSFFFNLTSPAEDSPIEDNNPPLVVAAESESSPKPDKKVVIPFYSTNQERLNKTSLPMEAFPDEYNCDLALEAADDPLVVNTQLINKQSLDAWWKNEPSKRGYNPFTGVPIKYGSTDLTKLSDANLNKAVESFRDIDLKKEIDDFVDRIVKLDTIVTEYKKTAEKAAVRYKNRQYLSSVNYQSEEIPIEFKDSISGSMIDYPVILDDIYVVDFFELMAEWQKHPTQRFKNPFTQKFFNKIEFHKLLDFEIKQFMKKVKKENGQIHLDVKIQTKIIEAKIHSYTNPLTTEQRLLKAQVSTLHDVPNAPEKFIVHNFRHAPITHPVILDDQYIVDFLELKAWWEKNSDNLYRNYFTNKPIKKIEYLKELKQEIDDYCTDIENKNEARILAISSLFANPKTQYQKFLTRSPVISHMPLTVRNKKST